MDIIKDDSFSIEIVKISSFFKSFLKNIGMIK